jgi:diguanylate cyclase (GGDEF)-like protein
MAMRANAIVAEHDGGGAPPACIILDLDHFKSINDGYGHHVGDAALTTAAQALRGALRDSDIVCRWGGEEFLVFLAGQNAGQALEVAERLGAALRQVRLAGAPTVRLTASFGVAARMPGEKVELWVDRADQALYEAKTAGRDCVREARAAGA